MTTVSVFVRCRPSIGCDDTIDVDVEEGTVKIAGCLASSAHVRTSDLQFTFDTAFGGSSSQDDIFNVVARPIITDVLKGINGTIFAYGQTGSGKTFTITGGVDKYSDRGLIPRTLSALFTMSDIGHSCVREVCTAANMYIVLRGVNFILGNLQRSML